LKQLLQQYASHGDEERFLIVSDAVYSMDGDLADLPRLARLTAEFDATLILDDAHGTGTLGATGSGAWEHSFTEVGDWRLETGEEPDLIPTVQVEYSKLPPGSLRQLSSPQPPAPSLSVIHIGTLSKALGSQGGFVAGSRALIDWLVSVARPFIYTTGLAPSACGAALKSLEIVRREPERRERLRAITEKLATSLCEMGFDARLQPSPIIPIIIGESEKAVALGKVLLEEGVWCPAIRPPTVPAGTSRLRLTASAALSDKQIAFVLEVFNKTRNR
jgi:7-keto-8-aminopelargonate synthetase-like enzyme